MKTKRIDRAGRRGTCSRCGRRRIIATMTSAVGRYEDGYWTGQLCHDCASRG